MALQPLGTVGSHEAPDPKATLVLPPWLTVMPPPALRAKIEILLLGRGAVFRPGSFIWNAVPLLMTLPFEMRIDVAPVRSAALVSIPWPVVAMATPFPMK